MAIKPIGYDVVVDVSGTQELLAFQRAVDQLARDSRAASKQIASMNKTMDSVKNAAKGMASAIGAAFSAAVVKDAVAFGDAMAKTADKIGLTTDELQALGHAAATAGVSQTSFEQAMQRFTRRTAEAVQGSGELVQTYKDLGIGLTDANGQMRATTDILDDFADKLAAAPNDAEQLRLAFKAFDSEGAVMVNLLRQGSDALEDLKQQARDTGIILESDLLDQAEALSDRMDLLSKQLRATIYPVLIQVAEVATTVAEGWREIGSAIQDTWDDFSTLEKSLYGIAAATAAISAAVWLNPLIAGVGAAVVAVGVLAAKWDDISEITSTYFQKTLAEADLWLNDLRLAMIKGTKSILDSIAQMVDGFVLEIAIAVQGVKNAIADTLDGIAGAAQDSSWFGGIADDINGMADALRIMPHVANDAQAAVADLWTDTIDGLERTNTYLERRVFQLQDRLSGALNNLTGDANETKQAIQELFNTTPTSGTGGTGGIGSSEKSISETADDFEKFIQTLEGFRTPAEVAAAAYDDLYNAGFEFAKVLDKSPTLMALYKRGLADLSDEMNQLSDQWQAVADISQTSIGGAFDAIIDQTKNVEDAFSTMLDEILRDIAKFLVSQAVQQLIQLMVQLATGVPTGSPSFAGGNIPGLYTAPLPSPSPAAVAFSAPLSDPLPTGRGALAAMSVRAAAPIGSASAASALGQSSDQTPVNVTVIDNVGVEVREERSGNGNEIKLFIEGEVKKLMGSGAMDRTMRANYGLRRSG